MYDGCPQRQGIPSGFSHCENLRDKIRQEEMGREENRKHFKETVIGLGSSLEKGVEEREILPGRERAWYEGRSLHQDSASRPL